LSFRGAEGIETSQSGDAFAYKHLAELNALLSRPLAIALKRPQQKSYPHINGLFVLLRASGLTYVAMGKKQTRLMLNQTVLASWEALNPAERYFALFEAWWQRGNGESIGERGGFGFWGNHFSNCIHFFKKTLQDQPVGKNLSANDFDRLRYYPGFHHLALMELFGFVAITLDAAVNNANWPVVNVDATRWGHVVLGCLSGSFAVGLFEENQAEEKLAMGLLDEIKAYRPELKNTLLLPQSEILADANVTFKVTLLKASRTLSISSAASLDDLASVILGAFDFDNDHLYEFSYKDVYGITASISHPYAENENGLFTPDYRVGQMPLYVGMNVTFLFDFGDNWEFLLVVEAIDTEGKPLAKPKVIKREGKSPEQYPGYDE
jgi:Plasmid pRiA4b ORF-3-like protein